MSKGQGSKNPKEKKLKNFQKPIDKYKKICYNIYVR